MSAIRRGTTAASLLSALTAAALVITSVLCLAAASAAPPAAPADATRALYAEVNDVAGLVAAAAAVGPLGGEIVLRPGNYAISAPLAFRNVNSLQIRGSGWSTTLRTQGGMDAIVFEDCGFCAVRDLLICADRDTPTGSGIVFRGQSSSNTVDFCRMCGFGESGVRFEGDPARPQSSNTVSRSHFIDNADAQLLSRNNNDYHFLQCQFGAHQRQGAKAPKLGTLLDHSSAGTYATNYHWGNTVALRLTGGCHFSRIENNRFEESLRQGLILGGEPGAALYLNIITGNTFHTNSKEAKGKYAAVEAHGACDTTFTSNQIFSWDNAAFRHLHSLWIAADCRAWIVTGNVFRHNVAQAIRCDEPKTHVIRDNISDGE